MKLISYSIIMRIPAVLILLLPFVPVRGNFGKGNGFNHLPDYVSFTDNGNSLTIVGNGRSADIYMDASDWDGVKIATENLAADFLKVTVMNSGNIQRKV